MVDVSLMAGPRPRLFRYHAANWLFHKPLFQSFHSLASTFY